MSDATLRDLVLKRREAETQPEDLWSALVLAALDGPDELSKLLEQPAGHRGTGEAQLQPASIGKLARAGR